MRLSELLGLTWADVDFAAGTIHVRCQLSRARIGQPARRMPPKTAAAVRAIPPAPQLAVMLNRHKQASRFDRGHDYVFATSRGTPLGHRNAHQRALTRAAERAGLNQEGEPRLRFHDLRHTFASHLIIDLRLDVAQVSRIVGHASTSITLDTYTHLFAEADHGAELRAQIASSEFTKTASIVHLAFDLRGRTSPERRACPDTLREQPCAAAANVSGDRSHLTKTCLTARVAGAVNATAAHAGTLMELAGLEPATSWVRYSPNTFPLAAAQLENAVTDLPQSVLGRPGIGRGDRDAGFDLIEQARHPDHEELVEGAGKDRAEPSPLEQRQAKHRRPSRARAHSRRAKRARGSGAFPGSLQTTHDDDVVLRRSCTCIQAKTVAATQRSFVKRTLRR